MKNIVLLSYGNQKEYQRAVYAIFSFLAWKGKAAENTRIVCFTDNPVYFKKYLGDIDIQYVLLTDELMKQMLGGTENIHRRKICVLQHVFAEYPGDDILFLDSDTFFYNDVSGIISQIQPENSLMHVREYRLEQAPKKYRDMMSRRLPNAEQFPLSFIKLIENNEFVIAEKTVSFNKEQYVWNSGVLGINNSHLPLLADMLSFNDRVFAETRWFISEQLSFALILQTFSKVTPAADFINHYYQSKEIADIFIGRSINEHFLNLTTAEKVAKIKASTLKMNRLIKLDLFVSISGGAFKRKKYGKGFRFAFKAIRKLPVSSWTFTYLKSTYNIHRPKGK